MTIKELLPMHPEFPTWYKSVGLTVASDTIEKRWAGIVSAINELTRDDIEAIIRVVFRSREAPAPQSIDRIRKTFQNADSAFEMHGNDREFEVLCGCVLAVTFQSSRDLAPSAALATTTSFCDGGRQTHQPMDLAGLAETALAQMAESARERPALADLIKHDAIDVNIDAAKIAKVIQQFDGATVAAALTTIAEAFKATVPHLDSYNATTISAINDFITVQDEELQMLWWLIGNRSWDLNRPFDSLGDARTLILPKELAQITKKLPGPISIKGILSRAGIGHAETLTIPKAVNCCDSDWLATLQTNTASRTSQPILFAISRKLETRDDNSWISGWAASANLDPNKALPVLTLANLFYRERLLSVG